MDFRNIPYLVFDMSGIKQADILNTGFQGVVDACQRVFDNSNLFKRNIQIL